jgi:hypothetical protein
MILEAIVLVAVFLGGFGLGRVKNKAKLAAAQAVLANAEAKVGAEAAQLIADVKKVL